MSRFDKTYCSQCGGEFGPGDEGFSHCSDHAGQRNRDDDCTSCGGSGSGGMGSGCTDCLGTGVDPQSDAALNHAYAEGRRDEQDAARATRRDAADTEPHGSDELNSACAPGESADPQSQGDTQ